MPAPAPSASVEDFFEFNEYCAASLEVDPATQDLEPLVVSAGDKLTKAVAARTAAQRLVNRATAHRDYAFGVLTDAVETLERKASGEFALGEDDPGYRRLFPQTPSQLAKTAIEDRTKVFQAFLAVAEDDETPAVLGKPVKAVAAAWSAYAAAARRLETAQNGLTKARGKEAAAKTDNITALRKLEGKLTDRFADKLKRVRGYFPPTKSGGKSKAKKPPDAPPTTTTTA